MMYRCFYPIKFSMDISTKQQAQQRSDQINSFYQELDALQRQGLATLSDEQHGAIRQFHNQLLASLEQRFQVDTDQHQKQLTRGMQITFLVAAFALCAAVFSLFQHFWWLLNLPMQILVLIAAPLLSLATANYLAKQQKSDYFILLAALISFACFVLNIVYLGKIFNLTPSENAMALWAVYALLLAYLYQSRLLLSLFIVGFIGFSASKIAIITGYDWQNMIERPENALLPAMAIFAAAFWQKPQFAHFQSVYRGLALACVYLCLLILAFWGEGSYLPWQGSTVESFYQLLALVVSSLMIAVGVRRNWRETYDLSSFFFIAFLYIKLFDWWWEIVPNYAFFFIIGLSAILFLMVFKRLRLKVGKGVRHE